DPEFVLECFAECIAVQFVEQALESRAVNNLIDGKAAGARNLWIIFVDFRQSLRRYELRYDQMFKRPAYQCRRAELPDTEIMYHSRSPFKPQTNTTAARWLYILFANEAAAALL